MPSVFKKAQTSSSVHSMIGEISNDSYPLMQPIVCSSFALVMLISCIPPPSWSSALL